MKMMDRKITNGSVRGIPEKVEENRVIPFILSTPQRDRHHTVLNQNGWELENYRKNPIIGFNHNLYGDMCSVSKANDIIGKDVGTKIEDIQGNLCLTGNGYFEPAELNLEADTVFRKLVLGTLSSASVGFIENGRGYWGQNEEAEGRENETYYFEGQELLEWSVVSMPSNTGASARALNTYMRQQTYSALMFAFERLGKDYRISQIESMRVRDVLDLLNGKDLEIKETDPDKVREMIREEMAQEERKKIIEKQQRDLKSLPPLY